MLSIYWSWVLIGFVVGLAFGVAVSFFVTWLVEKQTTVESGSDFERGFDRGWECSKEYQQRVVSSDMMNNSNKISDVAHEQLLNWYYRNMSAFDKEDVKCSDISH